MHQLSASTNFVVWHHTMTIKPSDSDSDSCKLKEEKMNLCRGKVSATAQKLAAVITVEAKEEVR